MKSIILIFCVNLLLSPLLAQGTAESDAYIKKGEQYTTDLQYDSALYYYTKALQLQKKPEQKLSIANKIADIYITTAKFDIAQALLNKYLTKEIPEKNAVRAESIDLLAEIVFRLGDFAGSRDLYEDALEIRMKIFEPNSMEIGNSYNHLGKIYYMLGEFRKAKEFIEKALEIRLEHLPPDDDEIASSYNNLGIIHGTFNNFDSSLYFFTRSLDIKLVNLPPDHPKLATTYSNMGNMNFNMGNYDEAFAQYKQSLDIRVKQYGPDHPLVASSCSSIGDCYYKKGIFDKSRFYYDKALATYTRVYGPQHTNVAHVRSQLASCYFKEQKYQEALDNYKHGVEIYRQIVGEDHLDLSRYYSNIAVCAFKLGETDTTLHYVNLSMRIINENPGHKLIFEDYVIMGDVLALKGDEKAGEYYDLAIANSTEILGKTSIRTLEPLLAAAAFYKDKKNFKKAEYYLYKTYKLFRDDISNENESIANYKFKRELLKYLLELGKYKEFKYDQEKDEQQLRDAFAVYAMGDHLLKIMIRDFNNESSSLAVPIQANRIYEGYIATVEKLYGLTNDEKYISKAFEIAEKIKSVTLLMALKESELRESRGINDPLIEEDRELSARLASVVQQLERVATEENIELQEELSTERVALHQKKDSLKKALTEKYPELYKYPFGEKGRLVEMVQDGMAADKALIEYLLTDSRIYVFVITSKEHTFFNIKKPEGLEEKILQLRQQLSKPPQDNNEMISFRKNAAEISDVLLKQPLQNIPGKIKDLVICTDGILGYIPFEILPLDANEDELLLQQYNISYIYSAAVYLQLKQRKRKEGNKKLFAGFAPEYIKKGSEETASLISYSNPREELSPLPMAMVEVNSIADLLKGDSYTGNTTTEAQFKELSEQYKIIHLAAHGFSDDASTLSSRIVFSEGTDSLNDGNLYANEIYGMKLNADLVVLSACNSGYGGIRNGEGIMSLSRAFTYAGCPSTVMSLWNVSDKASSEIMLSFYSHIKKGKAKDEALRLAKMDYLSATEDPILKHPFYWASFVPIGDMQPVLNSPKKIILVIIEVFLFLSLIAIGFTFYRKRKMRSIT